MPLLKEPETHYRLTNMEYDEVSLCAVGVNQPAKVVLFKSAIDKNLPKKNMSPDNCDVNHGKLPKNLPCPKCGTKKGGVKKAAGLMEDSYEEVIEELRTALKDQFGTSQEQYVWIRATFDDHVVYELSDKGVTKTYMVDYAELDEVITFGTPIEVELSSVVTMAPVTKAIAESQEAIAKVLRDRRGQFSNGYGRATAQEKKLMNETIAQVIAANEAAIAKATIAKNNPTGVNQYTSGGGKGKGRLTSHGGEPKHHQSQDMGRIGGKGRVSIGKQDHKGRSPVFVNGNKQIGGVHKQKSGTYAAKNNAGKVVSQGHATRNSAAIALKGHAARNPSGPKSSGKRSAYNPD